LDSEARRCASIIGGTCAFARRFGVFWAVYLA
jgi:hypothetical protein